MADCGRVISYLSLNGKQAEQPIRFMVERLILHLKVLHENPQLAGLVADYQIHHEEIWRFYSPGTSQYQLLDTWVKLQAGLAAFRGMLPITEGFFPNAPNTMSEDDAKRVQDYLLSRAQLLNLSLQTYPNTPVSGCPLIPLEGSAINQWLYRTYVGQISTALAAVDPGFTLDLSRRLESYPNFPLQLPWSGLPGPFWRQPSYGEEFSFVLRF